MAQCIWRKHYLRINLYPLQILLFPIGHESFAFAQFCQPNHIGRTILHTIYDKMFALIRIKHFLNKIMPPLCAYYSG